MALKRRYKDKSEIPEQYRSLFVEKDGEWVMDVDVSEDIGKLQSTLENVRSERNDAREKLKNYDGVDLENYKRLVEEKRKIDEKKLIDAGKVDELVAARVEEMRKEFQKQIDALTKGNNELNQQLSKELIDNKIMLEARGSGVRDTALDDVLLRGRNVFRLVDGKVVAMDGDKPRYGKDGKELQISEWIKGDLIEKAPHLFQEPSGPGSRPGSGSPSMPATGNVYKISRADARDTAKYESAKTEAAKNHQELTITD